MLDYIIMMGILVFLAFLLMHGSKYISSGNDNFFDMDNTTTSKRTREFLGQAERDGLVVPCDDLPKAYVLTAEYGFQRVHLTALSSYTLEKRFK